MTKLEEFYEKYPDSKIVVIAVPRKEDAERGESCSELTDAVISELFTPAVAEFSKNHPGTIKQIAVGPNIPTPMYLELIIRALR